MVALGRIYWYTTFCFATMLMQRCQWNDVWAFHFQGHHRCPRDPYIYVSSHLLCFEHLCADANFEIPKAIIHVCNYYFKYWPVKYFAAVVYSASSIQRPLNLYHTEFPSSIIQLTTMPLNFKAKVTYKAYKTQPKKTCISLTKYFSSAFWTIK